MCRTIIVVGMLMFKIKELVKVSHKSEIWSEDIGNLRETLDNERKVRASVHDEKQNAKLRKSDVYSKTSHFSTVKIAPSKTVWIEKGLHWIDETPLHAHGAVQRHSSHLRSEILLRIVMQNTTLDSTLTATQKPKNRIDLQELFKKRDVGYSNTIHLE